MSHSIFSRVTLTAVFCLLAGLTGCDGGAKPSIAAAPSQAFKAVDIAATDHARAFTLPDTQGKVRTLADSKGRVLVVFFGFTQCADVCPTTLLELAAVKDSLGADGQRVQGIFVTIDPERDTPEVLAAYVKVFGGDFLALRGTPEQTRAVADEFKIYYNKVAGRSEGSYTMDHTAGSYVFDAQGRQRLFVRYGAGAEALVHDLKLLLAEKS